MAGGKKNRWLLLLAIFGLLYVLMGPYLVDSEISGSFSIFLSYGVYFEIAWDSIFGFSYGFTSIDSFSSHTFFTIFSPICTFLGIALIFIASIFLFRDRLGNARRYTLLSFLGGLFGFLGTCFFIPFGLRVSADEFTFAGASSPYFNWFFFGVYIMGFFFFSLGFWGLFRFLLPSRKLSSESSLRLGTLASHRRNISQIRESYDTIPLHMLRQMLNVDSEEDLESLRQLLPPDLQYSVVGSDAVFLKETVSKVVDPEAIIRTTSKFSCVHCEAPLSLDDKICSNCTKPVVLCAICKLPIDFGEEMSYCDKCSTICHSDHLHTWIKIRMKCPTCLQSLLPTDIKPLSVSELVDLETSN